MSEDLKIAISGFLSNAWRIFSEIKIPGTEISFAVLFIGLALIPIGFQLLSIALGHNVGESDDDGSGYGTRSSKKAKISDERKNDVR